MAPVYMATATRESPLARASALFGGAASFVAVSLDTDVDPALDGLFVTAPRGDLSDDALARVDRFIDSGKPTVIGASAAYENATPATAATRGLDRLLRRRGIDVHADQLVAGKPTTFPPWILRRFPTPFDEPGTLFYGIDDLYLGNASSLDVHAPAARVLLRAGHDALVREPSGPPHPLPLDGTDGPAIVVQLGRLLVVSAHHAFVNAFGTVMREDPAADVERYAHAMAPSTFAFLRNILEWMTIDEENWRRCTAARHDPDHE
jgi:hypothetical protein